MKWPWQRTDLSLGRQGEELAVQFLRRKGYAIIERNAWQGRYEIDIVARKGDTIVFAEVRTQRPGNPVAPEDTVGPVKQRHIRQAARHYRTYHPDREAYYRFDIVAIVLPEAGEPEITHYEDAFQDR